MMPTPVPPRCRDSLSLVRLLPLLACAALLAGCQKRAPVVLGNGPDAIDQGSVSHTHNPQVALYTLRPHSPAQVTIEFGPTAAYGLRTWSVPASPSNPAGIFVAGMRGDTVYHLRALVRFQDGTQLLDTDHTFRTGHYKVSLLPDLTVQKFGLPQPGVELLNPAHGTYRPLVTDLDGHVLWSYPVPGFQSLRLVKMHRYEQSAWFTLVGWANWIRHILGFHTTGRPFLWDSSFWKYLPPDHLSPTLVNPIKQLPNGNFLMIIGPVGEIVLDTPNAEPPPHSTLVLREINLAGDTVYNLTIADLNRRLRAIGYSGPPLETMHHDVTLLPNGHMIVLTNATRNYTNLPGYPGTTRVNGDVLVELDQNFNPVWTWNEFDHLDINHHPIDFPDWTHTNAVIYTKDDGNLIVSMRTQDWVIKIDYRNGKGTGNVLWRLGPGGDFRLVGGTAPEDWNYGQHDPAIFGDRDAGVFDLGMMDNGYGRIMSDGKVCSTKGAPPCYSAAIIYRIDEKAKTAAIVFRKALPPSQFSPWGGSVQALPNGQIEADFCSAHLDTAEIYDFTRSANPQIVWHMRVDSATNVYRAQRLPSLYPGVQW